MLAVGGDGCQLSLWDLGAQARVWQAKGAKPNSIGLVDKVHITAAAFLEGYATKGGGGGGGGGEGSGCSAGRHVVLVGTASHKLLLYDTAAGRRPQLELTWRDARVMALAPEETGGWHGHLSCQGSWGLGMLHKSSVCMCATNYECPTSKCLTVRPPLFAAPHRTASLGRKRRRRRRGAGLACRPHGRLLEGRRRLSALACSAPRW